MTPRIVLRMIAASLLIGVMGLACEPQSSEPQVEVEARQPSILLITMDTTRADHLGFESRAVNTPELTTRAGRGLQFTHAYTTAPMTLPAHTSILTGLYPTDHGIRENTRRVDEKIELLAPRLKSQGYTTAAFVSGFPLAAQFGLARGFDHYDDDFVATAAERPAEDTTDRALLYLQERRGEPLFLWVHYFDPHDPYEPPEPFASRYPDDPYLGEIAYMDRELGRLADGFEALVGNRPFDVVIVADHGESRGDHGEMLHGNLLYQGVMRVPLLIYGSEILPATVDRSVSVRQVFDTILGWAGAESTGLELAGSLLDDEGQPAVAEALKPFLQYGWQPQFMAVGERLKILSSGDIEVYDVVADPTESRNLAGQVELEPGLAQALRDYSARALEAIKSGPGDLDQETRERLASLGYVGSEGRLTLDPSAPSPKDMVHLFHDLDIGAAMFVRKDFEQAIPVFSRVLAADPDNLVVCLRLAVAYSVLGNQDRAMSFFERAREIDSSSVDLRHYQAMHHFRARQWDLAEPLFESVLAQMPDRLPALEAMATIRTEQRRIEDASRLLAQIVELKRAPAAELVRLGELRMALSDTPGAIRAFERARSIQDQAFGHDLELGVCYLANRRFADAAASLDRVSPSHPGYAMALFKRAQVSVLLGEADQVDRIRIAYDAGDPTTRRLIENEALFGSVAFR